MKVDMTNLPSQFNGIALKNPEKPAVFWGETTYTFGWAHGLAKRLPSGSARSTASSPATAWGCG